MKDAHTLVDRLQQQVESQADSPFLQFLDGDGAIDVSLTYGDVDRIARWYSQHIRSVAPDASAAVLLFPPGPDFYVALLGCLYAGVVGVPLPCGPVDDELLERLDRVCAATGSGLILTGRDVGPRDRLDARFDVMEVRHEDAETADVAPQPREEACYMFTSGSTSEPKGVVMRHHNLLHNARAVVRDYDYGTDSVTVSWLPHFHAFGLLVNLFYTMEAGGTAVIMKPSDFADDPFSWLEAVSRYEATHTGSPNFGFDLCAQKMEDAPRDDVDLSSVRKMYSAGEPVRVETIERFAEAFPTVNPESISPMYGMSEVGTIAAKRSGAIDLLHVDIAALNEDRVDVVDPDAPRAKRIVGCGAPLDGLEVVAVDPSTARPQGPDAVGEIWIRGASVLDEYLNDQAADAWAHLDGDDGDPFLRSGDLGFVRDGVVYLTGRMKEVMIVNGKNYYPMDVEQTVTMSQPLLSDVRTAVFSVQPIEGPEQVIVVAEYPDHADAPDADDLDALAASINGAILQRNGVRVHEVAFVPEDRIPRTSSGKMQRNATKNAFLADELPFLHVAVLSQATASVRTQFASDDASDPATADADAPDADRPEVDSRDEVMSTADAARVDVVLDDLYAVFGSVLSGDPDLDADTLLGALGLGSVELIRLTRKINAAFDVEIEAIDVMKCASLGDLAEFIARPDAAPSDAASDGEVAAPVSRPLTINQRGLWIECKRNPDLYRYNTPVVYELNDDVDVDRLDEAFRVVQRRHPVLRSRIDTFDGEPRAVIVEDVVSIDRTASIATLEGRLDRLDAKARRPFALRRDEPLLDAEVVHGGDAPTLFYVNASHLILDGRGCQFLLQRVDRVYRCLERGEAVPDDLGEANFLDYPAWEDAYLDSDRADKARAFWAEKQDALFRGLNLPYDEAPTDAPLDARHIQTTIPADVFERIEDQARSLRVTPYAFLLSAYFLLLYRYTRERDVSIGTVMLNRPDDAFEDAIGYFSNLVPVAAHLDDADAFETLVQRVSDQLLRILSHQSLPFSEIAKAVDEQRPGAEGAASMLSAFFLYQDWTAVDDDGCFGRQHFDVFQATTGDLTFETLRLDDETVLFGKYDGRKLRESTVQLMMDRYLDLLAVLADAPDRAIGSLLAPDAAEREVLDAWNDTDRDVPTVDNLYARFHEQVETQPNAEAVVCGDERLTYRELEAEVDAIATTLAERGVTKGTRVGLLLPRSTYLSAAVLAVLKRGAEYVPLDPDVPADRLAFILDDAQPSLVLTTEATDVPVPCERVDVDASTPDRRAIESRDADPSWASYAPDDTLYVLYTSGSTGQPKGVAVAHDNLVHYHDAIVDRLGLTADDRVLAVTTMTFDIVFTEVVVPLLIGGVSCVAGVEAQKNGARLAEVIDAHDVTVMQATPTTHKLLLASGWRGADSLRMIISLGEALGADLAAHLLELDASVWNLYGPTENTIISTGCRVDDPDDVHIGTPLANVRVYVLDDERREVPVGAVGEMYLGGDLVAQGYLNRPDQTEAHFAPAPDGVGRDGERLYRTGDLVRQAPDGSIYFLGRNDHQVKIRGFRVELKEIEHVLTTHPAVHDACVVVVDTASGVPMLKACLTPEDEQTIPDADALRDHLRGFLPDYMIPSAYLRRDRMPLLPNGKRDRSAVLDGATPLDAVQREDDDPTPSDPTPVEETVAGVWRDVLETDAVDVERNFFDAGGNSLLVLDLQRALANRFGVSVRTVDLFRHTSIRAQAAWLTNGGDGAASSRADAADVTVAADSGASESSESSGASTAQFGRYGSLQFEDDPSRDALR